MTRTLCGAARARSPVARPSSSGDTTATNRNRRSGALRDDPRAFVGPRVRAKMYADPVLAPRTTRAGVASTHVKRTRADATARKSALEATHRQRGASGEDVDVGETTVSRAAAPSAASSAASSSVMALARATGDGECSFV